MHTHKQKKAEICTKERNTCTHTKHWGVSEKSCMYGKRWHWPLLRSSLNFFGFLSQRWGIEYWIKIECSVVWHLLRTLEGCLFWYADGTSPLKFRTLPYLMWSVWFKQAPQHKTHYEKMDVLMQWDGLHLVSLENLVGNMHQCSSLSSKD